MKAKALQADVTSRKKIDSAPQRDLSIDPVVAKGVAKRLVGLSYAACRERPSDQLAPNGTARSTSGADAPGTKEVSGAAAPVTTLCRRNVQLTFLFKSFNGKPKKRTLYTVLRSPHIDKKSREQFEIGIHQQRARLVVPMWSAAEMITEGAKIRINYNTYENE